jgi:uncharacterized membrane protein YoaK (UPF0700 family)
MSGTEETPVYLERVLGATAFAAGAVDVITFAKLGGILASAMTGNLAFMGYYLGRFSFASALGSAIALLGFVMGGSVGTLLGRGRGRDAALRLLLAAEVVLLAGAVALWLATAHGVESASRYGVITLLAVSMGLQSIVGKRVNLSNIPTVVFTSTLTNMVIALTEMAASGRFRVPADTRRQTVSFLLYFVGALAAGFAVHFHALVLIFLPLLAVGGALASQLRGA